MTSKSSICYFDTFCFCMSVKIACFTMAYTQLVGLISGIIYAAVLTRILVNNANEKFQYISPVWILYGILICLAAIILLFFFIILLIGLHKNKPGLVKAYLIFDTILIVIFAMLIISSIVNGYVDLPVIVTRIIQLFVNMYCLLLFRNYYISMKETPEQTA